MCLHRLAPALHSGFVPMCHLQQLEVLGRESKVEEPSWTVRSRSRATPLLVPKRGWNLAGNYCPWALHHWTGCVMHWGFPHVWPSEGLWGFPVHSHLLPHWRIPPAKSLVMSPARGGQSACKRGITRTLEAQVEPTEAVQHPAGTTMVSAASGSHFVVFIILFILGHVSIIIILSLWRRKFCLWTCVCGPCCAHSCPDQHAVVGELPTSSSPLCGVLNPDKTGWLPQGKACHSLDVLCSCRTPFLAVSNH